MQGTNPKEINDGQSLEERIELIERWLVQQGFQVETREKIYNNDGVQIAEFDIVITGKDDSTPIKHLVECRDRPSKGPSPGSWIEQLAGRRSRFKFDKVMAVSTTGFSPSAKDAAQSLHIELRNFQDLDYETVANWLPYNAPMVIRHGDFQSVNIFLDQNLDLESDNPLPQRVDTNQQIFVRKETGKRVTLKQIWQNILNENPQLFDDIKPNGPPKQLTVRADYSESRKYQLLRKENILPISHIDFQATLKLIIPNMPLSKVSEYVTQPTDDKNKEKIVEFAQWKGKEQDIIKELIFIGIPKKSTD